MEKQNNLILLKPKEIVPVDAETTGKLVNTIQYLQEQNQRLREWQENASKVLNKTEVFLSKLFPAARQNI